MRRNKIALLVATAILGIGLSSCGKDSYDGNYTGYEIEVNQAANNQPQNQYPNQPQNQYPNQYPNYPQNGGYGNNQSSVVEAKLNSSGETVTGTYTLAANTYQYNQNSSTPISYQLTANSTSSGSLSNVMLIPTGNGSNMGMSSCVLTGSLSSSNSGKTITGTLSPLNAGYCKSKQITLNRTN